jgi:cytoskeletal protein RodZ
MIFERKKINTETLSEYLREVRGNLHLDLEDVADKTGIKLVFLDSLESGEFLKLPPDVYVKGFLKQLAKFYNVEPDILIEQYKKERVIQQQIYKPTDLSKSWKKKYWEKLVITPKLVSLAAGILFVLVTLGYIIWQVSSINQTPNLEIIEPKDRQIIQDSVVNVAGRTNPGMSVSVNGENVFVDNQGNFKTQLGISAGQKVLVITAKNKFDKTASKTIAVVGQAQATQTANPVQLDLEFTDTVALKISIDDNPEQAITFHSGDTRKFEGQKQIVVSTSDAGATKATLNGQFLGTLGRDKENLKAISFFPESANINNIGQ